ncbi:MAG: hypothetical protein E7J90_08720 [Cutibacterium avidum]|nr:hypothetical protein [Cutibacterium avidum]
MSTDRPGHDGRSGGEGGRHGFGAPLSAITLMAVIGLGVGVTGIAHAATDGVPLSSLHTLHPAATSSRLPGPGDGSGTTEPSQSPTGFVADPGAEPSAPTDTASTPDASGTDAGPGTPTDGVSVGSGGSLDSPGQH